MRSIEHQSNDGARQRRPRQSGAALPSQEGHPRAKGSVGAAHRADASEPRFATLTPASQVSHRDLPNTLRRKVVLGNKASTLGEVETWLRGAGRQPSEGTLRMRMIEMVDEEKKHTYEKGEVDRFVSDLESAIPVLSEEANSDFLSKVLHRSPEPLSVEEGRQILTGIASGEGIPQGLRGLENEKSLSNGLGQVYEVEWGLGVDRVTGTRAYIVKGERASVDWTPFLPFLRPVAHSHPYWLNESIEGERRLKGRNKRDGPDIETKAVTDHMVKWAELLVPKGRGNDRLKIFPSGSDIAIPFKKGELHHTVFTPYVVGYKDREPWVLNPSNVASGAPDMRLKNSARLRFELTDLSRDPDNANVYHASISAHAGSELFWSGRARADMDAMAIFGGELTVQ